MSNTHPISLDRLRAAHATAAELVLMDPVYLPHFERAERELAAALAKSDAVARARAAVTAYKATG